MAFRDGAFSNDIVERLNRILNEAFNGLVSHGGVKATEQNDCWREQACVTCSVDTLGQV